ncbi:hypothetical protein KXD93_15510 [Mucilaginibacter sp. BJC16-A38]|uniref:hypothetical protein n=1 Tax=Mucilaginibacter phenanthrenivorans TaxID=1234842 RepID=UPI0021580039|nr:hypothetical protein [Mucilaginibacter phenanthrenivorans]MCR8559063.1 hypothetical protein [Mucilaginibacter phenanthrenivorans]
MKKLFLILILFFFAFYGCKKTGTKPAGSNPPTGTTPPAPTPLSIVITKLSPATYLTLSLVDSAGVKILSIPGKNNDTTYVIPSVKKGEHFEASIVTNISPAPGVDGVADVQFIYKGAELAGLSGGIYNKVFTVAIDIP